MSSAYDRMKQVKELLANSSLHLSPLLNLNNITRLLNESKSKVSNLLANSKSSATISGTKEFTSLTKLTNFVLYDDPDANQTATCLFDLSELDQNQVKFFANEIDAIEKELSEMNSHIRSIKNAYKTYHENLLSLCDRKDELFELFLDYYEEYFLNENQKTNKPSTCAMKNTRLNSKVTGLKLKCL